MQVSQSGSHNQNPLLECKRNGKSCRVPVGIGPDWAHNVGKIYQRVKTQEFLTEKLQ